MKINSILKKRRTLSFEIFPPKPEHDEDLSGIRKTLAAFTAQSPDFVSVTYGAGGHNRPRALEIAEIVLKLKMTPLSHLTAVGYTKEDARRITAALADSGVENILALRGDVPPQIKFPQAPWVDFHYALDLVEFVTSKNFCLGGAAYPEKHPESPDMAWDIEVIMRKERAGVNFFITQLFFDNDLFFKFRDRCRAAGSRAPIIAGIMPVFKAQQIRRIVEISDCSVPPALQAILERHANDNKAMEDAGSDYAASQIAELWREGVDGVHLYTMNKSRQVLDIVERSGVRSAEKENVLKENSSEKF
ncbi:MAG: methylenetetrahydrofolate reductase [Synergistaceae bacterium]|jgi:methylenetetrahydrofolate reductase (NADPH)|nr:methylenetetrahydrofolate reductase [Synergistaceae bacterium]